MVWLCVLIVACVVYVRMYACAYVPEHLDNLLVSALQSKGEWSQVTSSCSNIKEMSAGRRKERKGGKKGTEKGKSAGVSFL